MDPDAGVCSPLDLEAMIRDERAEPRYLRISLLESITNNFANDLTIGRGGFSVVYMGLLQNGNVAVKRLTQTVGVHETNFKQEVECLMSVKHKNIARFLGYCSDIQQKMGKVEGKGVLLEEQKRFLCLEYLPWSLDKYIKDPPGGHEWKTCYQIIKGICEGLHYLHQQKIVHLDLKPANILLDHNMVPKITDFGISKRFEEQQTHLIMTSNLCGSLGYIAPEVFHGRITFKSDIYSLGIIIVEILTGNKGYPDIDNVLEIWSIKFGKSPGDIQLEPVRVCAKIGMECTAFNPVERPDIRQILERLYEMESIYGASKMVDEVQSLWASETTMGLERISTEAGSSVVSNLVGKLSSMDVTVAPSQPQEICSVPDLHFEASTEATSSSVSATPSPLQRITGVLQGPGGSSRKILYDRSSEISKLLDVHPLELRFPWEPKRKIRCQVTLINRTDRYIGVCIRPTCEDTCSDICFTIDTNERTKLFYQTRKTKRSFPVGIMLPHSILVVPIKMVAQQEPPPNTMFEVLMVVNGSVKRLRKLLNLISGDYLNIDNQFLKRVEEYRGEVHRMTLKAIICDPASCQTLIHKQKFVPAPPEIEKIKGIDLHPTKTWILAHDGYSHVSILNYETQKIETVQQVIEQGSTRHMSSAKFIAKEQWFATGDTYGWVHIYSYTTKDKVMEVEADKPDREGGVMLAVHPTSPYLLTSSRGDRSIKLWDWSEGWECTRKFRNDFWLDRKAYVTWNPMDSDTFVNISYALTQVWNTHSSDLTTKSYGPLTSPASCRIYRYDHKDFMVAITDTFNQRGLQWWDIQKDEKVHEAFISHEEIFNFVCHPTLPILITQSNNSIGVWDARTYRLVQMVDCDITAQTMAFTGICDYEISALGMVLTCTKDSTRLILQCHNGISVMELNLPTLETIVPAY